MAAPTSIINLFDANTEKIQLAESTLSSIVMELSSADVFFWHPYGFLVHSFGFDHLGFEYRLHIWPPFRRIVQEPYWPIHNHTRRLTSIALFGRAVHRLYYISNGYRTGNVRYSVSHSGQKSILTYFGASCRPILINQRVSVQGDRYSLMPNQYHDVVVHESEIYATVVKFESRRLPCSFVIGEKQRECQYTFCRSACPVIDIAPTLLAIIRQLYRNKH